MDDRTLWSIVYVSSAVHPFDTEVMEAILGESRVFNAAHDVTGVLLHSDGNLMQCIEGPKSSLDLVYARIRASRRHHDLLELLNGPIEERCFKGWELGYAQPTRSALIELSTVRWEETLHADHGSGRIPWGLRHLQGFWERARR
ncbi:MAG: BLUF domain-containing protein [Armatimonadota bacterium]